MALSDGDMRRIAELVRSEVEALRGEFGDGASPVTGDSGGELGEEAATAIAPLARAAGSWNLASTGSGDQEAAANDAPVEIVQFENNLHAGGRVLVTTFSGRFREGVEAGGATASAGDQFGGFFALAYDEQSRRYIQLYADDLGKVTCDTTDRWDAEGDTLRLHFGDGSEGYVAELTNQGPARLAYNIYGATRGGRGRESGRGTLLKSATLKRK